MITNAQVTPPTNNNQQEGAAALQAPKSVNKDSNNNNKIHPSTNTSQPLTIHIPQGNPVGYTPAAAAIKTTDMSSNQSVSSFQDNITAVVSTETDCSDVHEHNNNNTPTPKLCEQKKTDDSAPDIELDAAETLLNIGSSSKPSRSSSNQNSPTELAAQTQQRTQNTSSSATHTTLSQESPEYKDIASMAGHPL